MDRSVEEIDRRVADRRDMLASLPAAMERAKALQRDKALGQKGTRDIGDMSDVDWDRVFHPAKERYINSPALVIHIGPRSGPAMCGVTKGRVCEDPTTVTLLVDRYCSRCWNKWAKRKSKETA